MTAGRSDHVRFGPFLLDLRARELRRNGIRVRVPDQSIQILAMLLEHPGQVVTREEVCQKLWPNGTVVEFDQSINAAVKRLRQALEDSAEDPRYVETLPRLGHRFIGAITGNSDADAISAKPVSLPTPGRLEGQTVSHYRILERIGVGGMGVVYKAADTRLGRTVALKFLPDEFADDKAALERFQREGRAASALNHPNICTLYDVGQAGAHPFLAMELLEGQTLLQLLAAGPLPTDTILDLGVQIAEALDAAHSKGIVHRDIKPPNIFVTTRGTAKVMDFGLAKLAPERGDILTSGVATEGLRTTPGSPMGTAAYMSPEQARGEALDTRTDLFSFGVVLYEMTTSQRPFTGNTPAALFDAILHNAPVSLLQLNQRAPTKLEEIVNKLLEKDRELRYQYAADLRADLKRLKRDTNPEAAGAKAITSDRGVSARSEAPLGLRATQAQPVSARFRSRSVLALGVPIVCLGIAGGWFLRSRPAATTGPILTRLTSESGLATDPSLSPDGRMLAYASDFAGSGGLDIWVRQISGGEAVRITHDGMNNREPSFSPDGSRIVFSSDRARGGVYIVPALGGEPRQVTTQGRCPRFSPDGKQIVYWSGNDINIGPRDSQRILVVPADGGSPRVLSSGFFTARHPVWSPDGSRVLFVGTQDDPGKEAVIDWWIVPAAGGLATRLELGRSLPRQMIYPDPVAWTPDQKVVFAATLGDVRNVWRIPVASDGSRLTGSPERITVSGGIETSASLVGSRLAFAAENNAIDIWSLPVDTNRGLVRGEMQRLTHNAGSNFYPAASSDGSRLVFRSDRRGSADVWFKDSYRGTESPVFGSADGHVPFLSADGSTAVYTNYVGDDISTFLIGIRPDGGFGVPRKVCGADCANPWGGSASAKTLLFSSEFPPRAIYALDVETGQKRKVLESAVPMIVRPRFSADDKWIAFLLRQGSAFRIFVAPYDGDVKREDRWVAITDGSFADHLPHWSPDGGLLYFYSDRDGNICLWAQRLEPGSKHPVGQPAAVQHLHTARQNLRSVPLIQRGMSVTHERIFLSAGEVTGNIWMAEYGVK
jgi:serine/threonine protein kinase/Tol biopolymer transport system component